MRDEGCTSLPEYATFYVHADDGAILSGAGGNPEVMRDGTACVVAAPLVRDVASGERLLLSYRVAGPFVPSRTTGITVP